VIGCVGPYPGADPSSPYKRVTPRHRDPMIGLSVPHARVTRRDPRTCAQLRAGHYWGGRLLRCSRSQSEGPHQDSGLRVGGRSDGLEDADEAVFPGPIALLPLDAKAARTVRWTFGAQGDGTSDTGGRPDRWLLRGRDSWGTETVENWRLRVRPGVQTSSKRIIRYFVESTEDRCGSGELGCRASHVRADRARSGDLVRVREPGVRGSLRRKRDFGVASLHSRVDRLCVLERAGVMRG
jgi:hypothetical protein